nr:hypothetical protein [Tanacetum cinerariifolium]GEX82982.1 hypothetical protein [Tanacetum cinerariifolium]
MTKLVLLALRERNIEPSVFFLASKDETTSILKKFITEIENLVDKKVKVIICDNGTEFKNSVMKDFCAMRADSKSPTTFWAEAVNTACYVENRELVVKPHNKIPYELFRDKTHALSFIRPFGCRVTILNTLDHLGKFNGKADEGTNSDDFADGLPLFDSSPKLSDDAGSQSSGNAGKKHDKVSDKENRALNELKFAFENLNIKYLNDPKIPGLETIATNDDSEEEADFANSESSIYVSPTPTTRTHKDHPLKQVIRSLNTQVQTKIKLKPTNK